MRINRKSLLIILGLAFGVSASTNNYYYIVRSGDNLSQILYDYGLRPIYGKQGSLKRVLELNPQIVTS